MDERNDTSNSVGKPYCKQIAKLPLEFSAKGIAQDLNNATQIYHFLKAVPHFKFSTVCLVKIAQRLGVSSMQLVEVISFVKRDSNQSPATVFLF